MIGGRIADDAAQDAGGLPTLDRRGLRELRLQLTLGRRLISECNVPNTGFVGRVASAPEIGCLTRKFDEERSRLFNRLTGDAMSEAQLTPEQAVATQRALKAKGLLAEKEALDGVFGPATREAIGNWQRSMGVPATGFGSVDLLAALQSPAANDIVNFSLELLPSILETRRTHSAGTHAVHGYAEVPNYAASHGCVRTFIADQPRIYEQLHYGESIFVY